MGSFDFTCCVSGLPISSGDPVKYILLTENPYEDNIVCNSHDMWFPRTWPLRGQYDTYGSIENYDEGCPSAYSIVEGLNIDLVELGMGNNACHDIPTRKGMSLHEILNAILEGRLKVIRDTRKEATQYPDGVPSLLKIEKLISQNGFEYKIATSYGSPGFFVDERQWGWVRVRWAPYKDKQAHLEKLLPVLQQHYSAMLTVGTGRYADDVEIQVMPKPSIKGSRLLLDEPQEKPLQIGQGMIHQGVWDEVIGRSPSFEIVRQEVQEEWNAQIAEESPLEKELNTESGINVRKWLRIARADKSSASYLINKEKIPYTLGLAAHFDLITKKHRQNPFTDNQVKDFLDDVTGFTILHEIIDPIRYWWRPSFSCGPQLGEYDKHAIWHTKLADISVNLEKKREDQ